MNYRRAVWTGQCRAGLLEPPADSSAKTRLHVNEYSIQIAAVYVREKFLFFYVGRKQGLDADHQEKDDAFVGLN